MKLHRSHSRFLAFAAAILLTLALGACGLDSDDSGTSLSGSSGSTATTGTVALLITDAPTDDFDEVNIRLTRVSLIGGDNGPVEIFSGDRTINLLELRDHSEFFSLAEVPVGSYDKIRLDVAAVELVRLDAQGDIVEVIEPRLPSGRIDLNPRRSFEVKSGETLILQLDLDAEKSIHVVEAGNSGRYNFRPVVFVDIIERAKPARFTKVHGTVAGVDAEARSFELCGAFDYYGGASETERCLTVMTGGGTSIFDPAGLTNFEAIVVDGPASVIGRMTHAGTGIVLDAHLVYLGDHEDLVRIRGVVSSDYDDVSGEFGVDVTRSSVFAAGEVIDVGLLAGARILSRNGAELGTADIRTGLETRILGIQTGAEPEVRAIAVFLPDMTDVARLSGVIGAVDLPASQFMLLPNEGGNISFDRLICVEPATNLYLISGMSSIGISLGELELDASADVYGHMAADLSCFKAVTVLAFDSADNGELQ